MTAMEPTTTSSPRPRTLQADLLADLRQATPMPIVRPKAEQSASVRAERPDPTVPETLVVDVRVTPRNWSAPSIRTGGTGTDLVLTAGPVRVSISGFGSLARPAAWAGWVRWIPLDPSRAPVDRRPAENATARASDAAAALGGPA